MTASSTLVPCKASFNLLALQKALDIPVLRYGIIEAGDCRWNAKRNQPLTILLNPAQTSITGGVLASIELHELEGTPVCGKSLAIPACYINPVRISHSSCITANLKMMHYYLLAAFLVWRYTATRRMIMQSFQDAQSLPLTLVGIQLFLLLLILIIIRSGVLLLI